MRFLLLCVLFSKLAMTQNLEIISEISTIESKILGDWHLTQVYVIDGFHIDSDSNLFKSSETGDKKITFTNDSLLRHRDTTLRFYTSTSGYLYNIKYDPVLDRFQLNTFLKRKRKRKTKAIPEESYDIIKITPNRLVVKSYHHNMQGLEDYSFSVVSVYERSRTNGLSDLLKRGSWQSCSFDKSQHYKSELDTLEFFHANNDARCEKALSIEKSDFKSGIYEDIVSLSSSSNFSGYYATFPFELDQDKKLLYLYRKEVKVYNIIELSEEKLLISLNKSETLNANDQIDNHK